jgi:hypothetical protein
MKERYHNVEVTWDGVKRTITVHFKVLSKLQGCFFVYGASSIKVVICGMRYEMLCTIKLF